MRCLWPLLAAGLACALPARAEPPVAGAQSYPPGFEAELRAAILANGDVIARALDGPDPVQSLMQDDIDKDLSLLDQLRPKVLNGRDVALFVGPDCAACAKAKRELHEITARYGLTFILHDLSEPQAARWAKALGLEAAPFYVLPKMILRGAMPPVVVEKYLARAAKASD